MKLAERLDAERIAWVDNFLDAEACRELVDELGYALWRTSSVVNRAPTGGLVTFESRRRRSRTAAQEWFSAPLQARLRVIERRAGRLGALSRSHLEPWQAIRYGNRDHFDEHHDAGLFGDEPAGERSTTLLLYLQTPFEGGATVFPALGLRITAQAGRLLLWRNLLANGAPDPAMRHSALPVRKGGKTVLTTWARERPVK